VNKSRAFLLIFDDWGLILKNNQKASVQNRFFRWIKPAEILTNTKSYQIGDKLE